MFDSNKTWFCKQLRTEDAKQISEQLNIAISEADHSEAIKLFQKVKKYMKIRINENYFLPLKNIHTCLAKLDIPENTAFITMGINCILIELFYEMKNGYDESREGGTVGNAYKEILPLLDPTISEDLAILFYKGIRCGILHQGQTKNNTALTYQLDTIIQPNGPYYLCNPQTLFEKLKNLYRLYWKDISEKNYSDELAINLIQKYNYILTHIS